MFYHGTNPGITLSSLLVVAGVNNGLLPTLLQCLMDERHYTWRGGRKRLWTRLLIYSLNYLLIYCLQTEMQWWWTWVAERRCRCTSFTVKFTQSASVLMESLSRPFCFCSVILVRPLITVSIFKNFFKCFNLETFERWQVNLEDSD